MQILVNVVLTVVAILFSVEFCYCSLRLVDRVQGRKRRLAAGIVAAMLTFGFYLVIWILLLRTVAMIAGAIPD